MAELSMAEKVSVLLRAKYTALAIRSKEEVRVERLLRRVAEVTRSKADDAPFEIRFWSCTKGITDRDGEPINGGAREPLQALEHLQAADERAVYVFRDLHKFFDDAQVLRGIRDTARILKQTPPEKARVLVLLSPALDLPVELEADVHMVSWPLPKREELRLVLDQAVNALRAEVQKAVKDAGYDPEAIVSAALGLTAEEAYSAFSRSIVELQRLDVNLIMAEKKNIVAKSGALEWMEGLPKGLDDIGDMDEAKEWLVIRREGFSEAAQAYGLPTPKGVLFLGVPGSGKTETAKAVGAAWSLPVLRLKVGRIFGSLMGESEERLSRSLETTELVAPCVLVIDELDKVVGGGQGGDHDGGTSSRVRGEILTWLQDRTAPVFVVGTANNAEEMSASAPEMLRKGRWDEIFFVDLPSIEGRKSIFDVHVKRRNLSGIDTAALAQMAVGFSGAEIAATVTDAMFTAFRDGARPTSTDDIMAEVARTVPTSASSKERIDRLRELAKGRTRPASRAGRMKIVAPKEVQDRRIEA